MLRKRSLSLLLACLACSTSLAWAQDTCKPETRNAEIDLYAGAPFGARAWRKLNNLGDLGISGESYAYGDYQVADDWRKRMASVAPGNQYLNNPGYNCRLGYALEVLNKRLSTYGTQSVVMKQWLVGQEAVLKACAGEGATALPDVPTGTDLKPDETTLLAQDRAYQNAAMLFYSKPVDAVAAFRAIAQTDSPHRAAARYNVANLLANAKNVVEARKEARAILADPQLVSVHAITQDLLGYISNVEDTAEGWSDLLVDTVATLNQPAEKILATEEAKRQYGKALYDIEYAGVSAKQDDWWVTNKLPENPTISKALADTARTQPMIMWMMAGQSISQPYQQAPWAAIGQKWQAWATSYVDRAQALQSTPLPALPKRVLDALKASADEPSRKQLWQQAKDAADAAQKTCGTAPETAALALLAEHATRVSAMAGAYDEIYANWPGLGLAGTEALERYILPALMQHLLVSGNVEEGRRLRDKLLTHDFLTQLGEGDTSWQRAPYAEFMAFVAEDQAKFVDALAQMQEPLSPALLNLLPAAKLRELAETATLKPEQKALLLRAAWTRNYALGIENSEAVTKAMLAANPEISKTLEDVGKANPGISNDHAWLLTILRHPRFGILVNSPDYSDPLETKRTNFAELDPYDPNDKNWWCPLEPDRNLAKLRQEFASAAEATSLYGDAKAWAPLVEDGTVKRLLAVRETVLARHPMVKAINRKEVQRLAKAPSAPRRLAEAAMRWGKVSKGLDAAPEALALAVRATRYGCRWHGSVKPFSKPAQELLKQKFPATTWAAQTPYWFDCLDQTYDANYNKVPNCKPRTWPKQAMPK